MADHDPQDTRALLCDWIIDMASQMPDYDRAVTVWLETNVEREGIETVELLSALWIGLMRELSGQTETTEASSQLINLLIADTTPEWLRPLCDTYRGAGTLELVSASVKASIQVMAQQMGEELFLAGLDGKTQD